MHGVQPKREGKAHQIGAPQARLASAIASRVSRISAGDRRQSEKMQAHNDDADAGRDDRSAACHRRSNAPPIALALAPSATNTVEKPSTNKQAATTVSRRTRGSPSAPPAVRASAGEIDEVGRHERQHAGRQEAQHPRDERSSDGHIRHGA